MRDAALTQIRAVSGFSTINVAVGDAFGTVLNKGPQRAVVLTFDSFEHRPSDFGTVETIWRWQLHLLEKANPDAQAAEAFFAADVQALLTRFDQFPKLNNTAGVLDAAITEGYWVPEDILLATTRYFHYGLTCEVTEETAVVYQG